MRIHIHTPHHDSRYNPLSAADVAAMARRIEAAGLDGIWKGHHLPVAGDAFRSTFLDPLAHLMVAGLATRTVELGTSIYNAPLTNAAELAQRVLTLQAYVPGRFTFGVGTGSQAIEYEQAGLDYADRFRRLDSHMRYIRSLYESPPDQNTPPMFAGMEAHVSLPVGELTMPARIGRPPFVLGAWASPVQIRRAVEDYDGWMGSGGPGAAARGWRESLSEGVKRYRDRGGTRALVTTIGIDLRMPDETLEDTGRFHLRCGPQAATERLGILKDMGFDDVILHLEDAVDRGATGYEPYARAETFEQIRALLPKETQDGRAAWRARAGVRRAGAPA